MIQEITKDLCVLYMSYFFLPSFLCNIVFESYIIYFAKDVVAMTNSDFSKIKFAMKGGHQLMWAIRTYNFDNEIRAVLTKRPYIDKNI